MNLIGLPNYYRFPFDSPDGVAFDAITEDPTPYHQLGEDEVVVFIKSHHPSFRSTLLRLSQTQFNEQYLTEN